MNSSDLLLEPADGALWTRIDDEVVILAMSSSEYFGLRGSAVRMWELIAEKTNTEDAIVRQMAGEFLADETTIRNDVAATLERLAARGLVRGR